MSSRTFVDAHLHCWDRRRLRLPWLDDEAAAPLTAVPADLPQQGGPRAAVFVEAAAAPEDAVSEARWAAGLGPPIAVVVARAPVETGDAVRSSLDAFAALPAVTAIRRVLQDEPEALLTDPRTARGLRAVGERGLVFDACVRHHQLGDLLRLVRGAPGTTVVLDHLGKPPLRSGWGSSEAEAWHHGLQALAGEPGTVVKLSGLAAEAGPGDLSAQARPFLEAALEAFGPARAMAGSDWPLSRLHRPDETYDDWFALLSDGLGLQDRDRADVLHRTAARTYRIPLEALTEETA